jgi:hypothetical protein
MVSNNEAAHLSVIEGMRGKCECGGECGHQAGQEAMKEPSQPHNPAGLQRFDAALRQLQMAKLEHEHRKLRASAADAARELEFELTLEKLTYEASLDGVPVRHITDSHEQAFEALEAAQNRVA